jgi:hypothetical protein
MFPVETVVSVVAGGASRRDVIVNGDSEGVVNKVMIDGQRRV